MEAIKIRDVIPALVTMVFFALCLHFAGKAKEGAWHTVGMQLWEKQEWHKLRALGENLDRVGKEDVESLYLAMLASEQMGDLQTAKLFASRLSESRVLNWKLEKQLAKSYTPETFRKKAALFRTRSIFAITGVLIFILILSLRRKAPYKMAPALISAAGIVILML